MASGRARGAHREGGRAGKRRAQHRTETAERGAPEGQEKCGTTHHDTHGTDTTHTAHTLRAPAACPVGGQSGEGQRLTSDAPHIGGRHPPRGRPWHDMVTYLRSWWRCVAPPLPTIRLYAAAYLLSPFAPFRLLRKRAYGRGVGTSRLRLVVTICFCWRGCRSCLVFVA